MRRSWLIHLAVYGFYLLIAVLITYPLIAQFSSAFAGFVYGDAYEMAHHIWWFKHALQTGQPLFYQTMLAYPNGIEGVTLWADPLQFFPAWLFAFVMPLASAANLAILLTLALNGWAMFFLTRYMVGEMRARQVVPLQNTLDAGAQHAAPLQGNPSGRAGLRPAPTSATIAPALIAGLVFMLFPTMQGHLGAGHAGLLVQWTVPLLVYALLRLREPRRSPERTGWRRIALAAAFFFLSATGHTLELIYVLMPLTLVYGLMLMVRREWVALRRTVIAVLVGGAILAVFLIPVFRATFGTSAYTEEGGVVRYSADLLAVVTPSFRNPLFAGLDYSRQVLGVNLDEGTAYIGVIAALLSLIAVWKVRAARGWLALALIAWALALGPLLKLLDQPLSFTLDGYSSYVTLPFALIANLPLIELARTPGRFDFALALAVAALAGLGAAYLWDRIRWQAAIKWAGAALLMVGIAAEYQVFAPLPLSPAAIPQPIRDLAGRNDLRAVFDIPWDNLVAAKDGLYLQTAHDHPLIAGHVTRSTPVSPAKLTLLQTTLDPALLRAVGADAVIVHREQDADGSLEARARAHLGDPVYEDDSLALFLTPPSSNSPAFTALPTSQTAISTEADTYVYTPGDGWISFSADLTGTDRQIDLLLDGAIVGRFTLDGTTAIQVPLPVSAQSFETLALAPDPPCPEHFDPALECRTVTLANLNLQYTPAQASPAVDFEQGVTLARYTVPGNEPSGGTLAVWLWWQFDQAVDTDDIRFVHLINAAGDLVTQQDNPLGSIAAGETRAEQVEISLPADLPPGDYTVSAGWYHYPDITNFRVLASGEGAATLGIITVTP